MASAGLTDLVAPPRVWGFFGFRGQRGRLRRTVAILPSDHEETAAIRLRCLPGRTGLHGLLWLLRDRPSQGRPRSRRRAGPRGSRTARKRQTKLDRLHPAPPCGDGPGGPSTSAAPGFWRRSLKQQTTPGRSFRGAPRFYFQKLVRTPTVTLRPGRGATSLRNDVCTRASRSVRLLPRTNRSKVDRPTARRRFAWAATSV